VKWIKPNLKQMLRLLLGLYLFGFGLAMMIHSGLGVAPWDVLGLGITKQTGWSFGVVSVLISGVVLLLWIPIKQKPGIGTIINAVSIGPFADLSKPLIPTFNDFWPNLVLMILGLMFVALGSGLYLSAGLGGGPRDGLMVGLTRVTGFQFWQVRTVCEGIVLGTGWLLGGTVGIGTAIFAIGIGYLSQLAMKLFGFDPKKDQRVPEIE
jgi:uncharacterized membrane protein YczE